MVGAGFLVLAEVVEIARAGESALETGRGGEDLTGDAADQDAGTDQDEGVSPVGGTH